MAKVTLQGVEKVYPNKFKAVHNLDLEILDGEFLVLVGPSGCAKSTTLRMIAGLEDITSGTLKIGDKVVNDIEPKDREIAMVFQNYALYPHMTVYDNMAFSLKITKIPKEEISTRVRKVAGILGIEDILDRKPKELSGGQQQRVAVGRAIIRNPKVFLFDEPLSNLDAKLRVHMRVQLSQLHKKLKTTMIYVTHDQVEAMTMGDRICVLHQGRIMQVDKPLHLYHYPANKFVASFIGSPAMNLVEGVLVKENNEIYVKIGEKKLTLPESKAEKVKSHVGEKIYFGIRPEYIFIGNTKYKEEIKGILQVVEHMGNESFVHFNIGNLQLIARIHSIESKDMKYGDEVTFVIDMKNCHIFHYESEENISL